MTIGEGVPEMFRIGLDGERQALEILAEGIKFSPEDGDDASRDASPRFPAAEDPQ